MAIEVLTYLILALGCVCAAPTNEAAASTDAATKDLQSKDDLSAEASSYARTYNDWGGYPGSSYNSYVVGYGLLDDKYTPYSSNGGYDYRGYDRGYQDYGYGAGGAGGAGYGGYKGYSGYDQGGYGTSSLAGNGGYGGYGGNGGLNSYYGYNSPSYQGGYHLGHGYNNKNRGYGNIYSSGITPSLVTGYRGYSRR